MPVNAEDIRQVYRRGEPDESRALDGVDFSVKEGEFVLVAGANGSGKSTLLQCLSGLRKPTRGRVIVDGPRALSIQFPERALFASTVIDDIMFGPQNLGMKKVEARERALEASCQAGLNNDLLDRDPRTLSHGQRRLVSIAGVIAVRPQYLFLDEPTAGLDPASKEHIVKMLIHLNSDGMAVVVASHDLAHFMGACGRILIMGQGKVIFDGRPEDLVSLDDTAGLSLPPSLAVARCLRQKGIDVPWNISPEAAAAHIRRIHEGLD